METVRATVRATAPVRSMPQTRQEGFGKGLVEDNQGYLSPRPFA